GRAEQLCAPGDFEVLEVAGESAIVVRADDGLHAHLNLCRHRGSRLLCGSGSIRGAIRCPYHGWSYALDGRLVASPFVESADVPRGADRLHRVGVETWGGFVFLHFSPGRAQPLAAQLGAVPQRLIRYP